MKSFTHGYVTKWFINNPNSATYHLDKIIFSRNLFGCFTWDSATAPPIFILHEQVFIHIFAQFQLRFMTLDSFMTFQVLNRVFSSFVCIQLHERISNVVTLKLHSIGNVRINTGYDSLQNWSPNMSSKDFKCLCTEW